MVTKRLINEGEESLKGVAGTKTIGDLYMYHMIEQLC